MFERAMNEARKEQERRRRLHTASPHLPMVVRGENQDDREPDALDDPLLLAIISVVIVVAATVVLFLEL